MAYFRENGVKNIDTYFKEYYFTGSHDAAIYAVLNKEADIGCAKNTVFEMMVRNDTSVKNNLVILATSPDVPSNGLGLRKDIKPSVKEMLKKALLGMERDPEGKKVLKEFGILKFIETTRENYQPVFDATRKAGINLETYEYINK
jgi:phosphonate transport system substrate-binding protein